MLPPIFVSKICLLNVVGSFLQPSLWNWLETTNNSSKLRTLENVGRNYQLNRVATWNFYTNSLKVCVLDSVLVWSLELPTLRVAVPNELRRCITFLSTHLTDLSHDFLRRTGSARMNKIPQYVSALQRFVVDWWRIVPRRDFQIRP